MGRQLHAIIGRGGVGIEKPRGDPKVTYPIVEYDQLDPLLQPQSAVTMGYVYRQTAITQLTNLLIFGDNPSGEMFYVERRQAAEGRAGSDPPHPLQRRQRAAKTLLQIIQEKNTTQGKTPATRADLRFGEGPDGQIFLLNKADGVVRVLVQ